MVAATIFAGVSISACCCSGIDVGTDCPIPPYKVYLERDFARVGILGRGTYTGGLDIGFGWGAFFSSDNNLQEIGQGEDVAGFLCSYRTRVTNNGVLKTRWLIFGLPWWYILALFLRAPLDRQALSWGRKAEIRLWERAAKRRLRQSIKFDSNPICHGCGYDMRATRERCPECGWVPDFPTLPEARRI